MYKVSFSAIVIFTCVILFTIPISIVFYYKFFTNQEITHELQVKAIPIKMNYSFWTNIILASCRGIFLFPYSEALLCFAVVNFEQFLISCDIIK